jgi:hypothetical protein
MLRTSKWESSDLVSDDGMFFPLAKLNGLECIIVDLYTYKGKSMIGLAEEDVERGISRILGRDKMKVCFQEVGSVRYCELWRFWSRACVWC